MNELTVHSSTHTYKVVIKEKIRHDISSYLQKDYSSILIVTDDQVAKLYLDDVKESLSQFNVYHSIVPHGEASKTIETYYSLHTDALTFGLDRDSLIIALGGGVVGDLAGFVAATFMRGIDYIQVPTTILAHDSSVGGKVAINHELGKNMIGNFYPPKAVLYDVNTLETLGESEVRSGYAELIKEAFIANKDFLNTLFTIDVQQVTNEQLIEHLYNGINIKAKIVEEDEKESGVRMFLNLGHTLGHAFEAEFGYGVMNHGEAVAIGMLFALQLSEKQFNIKLPYDTYYDWLKRNKYPLNIPQIEPEKLVDRMKSDKKTKMNQIKMVLLKDIAQPITVDLDDQYLLDELHSFMQELMNK